MRKAVLKWKISLSVLFLLCFAAYIVLAILVAAWGVVNPNNRTPLFTQLLSIYATPMGTIWGGLLVARQRKKSETREPDTWQLWAVFTLTLIWNLLIMGRFALFTFDVLPDDKLAHVTAFQDAVAGFAGLPLATGLALLFSNPGNNVASDD